MAEEQRILVQSTTSTQNSGFYDYIFPVFEEETGLNVDVVAIGTGQAIRNARNGDADVLLVHAKAADEEFVAGGFDVNRFDLMYNDFVIIGPASDPSQVGQAKGLKAALDRIYTGAAPFVSRGDDSGTIRQNSDCGGCAGICLRLAWPGIAKLEPEWGPLSAPQLKCGPIL